MLNLSVVEVITLHDSAEENKTILNISLLKSSLASHIYYDNIEDKIISVVSSLIKNHAFFDGNKRTALLVLVYLLSDNNFKIPTDSTLFNAVVGFASSKIDKDGFKNLYSRTFDMKTQIELSGVGRNVKRMGVIYYVNKEHDIISECCTFSESHTNHNELLVNVETFLVNFSKRDDFICWLKECEVSGFGDLQGDSPVWLSLMNTRFTIPKKYL